MCMESVLDGPFILTSDEIGRVIQETSPGVFALGRGRQALVKPSIVGRSDSDVVQKLLSYAWHDSHFAFRLCVSAEAAFLAECALFHDLQPAWNLLHPEQPAGSRLKCPRCARFDY